MSTNTQASKSAELPTFGVDVSRDILRAITGEPRDPAFSKRLTGADSSVVTDHGVQGEDALVGEGDDSLVVAFALGDCAVVVGRGDGV